MPGVIYKNIAVTFISRLLIAGFGLIIAVLLSRYLGATGRGEQSLIITLITFIIIVNGMVGASAISYLIPRYPFHILIFPAYLWVLLVSIVAMILLPFLNLVPDAYLIHVSLLSFILGIYSVNVSVLISKERIHAANLLGIIQSAFVIMYLLFAFLIANDQGVESYIKSLYAGYIISMLLSFYLIRTCFYRKERASGSQSLQAIKQLFILGFYNQAAVLMQMLSFRISYYILNQNYGAGQVGIYANAVTVAESVWLIGRSMAMVQYSKIVNSKDKGVSLKLTSRFVKECMCISFVVLLVLFIIPDSMYGFIFGTEFNALQILIRILSPGILFFSGALIMLSYFSGVGKNYVNTIASIAGLVITLLLGFVFIPKYGMPGAAVVASISYGITALVSLFFMLSEKKIG